MQPCVMITQDCVRRRALRAELRSLSKEERQRQQKAVEEVVKQAKVVCATLTGVATFQLRDLTFDVTVVDEAAQACSSIHVPKHSSTVEALYTAI